MTRAFVCGHPITHSRSPLIHRYWLQLHAIEGEYEPVDVSEAGFPDFILHYSQLGFVGGNITLPHKTRAWTEVRRRDQAAEKIGAINTVWLENGEPVGSNTDAYGFVANLDHRAPGWDCGRTAVVLGAGGAALAVLYALLQRGFTKIRIVNRTLSRAQMLVRTAPRQVFAHGWNQADALLSDTDLLVNTTTIGMPGVSGRGLAVENLPAHAIVTDIVYTPMETPLLKSAADVGLLTVDGLGMLLHQAVPGFERWFGRRPEVTDALRQHVLADLESAK